jgi:hypothetical protein
MNSNELPFPWMNTETGVVPAGISLAHRLAQEGMRFFDTTLCILPPTAPLSSSPEDCSLPSVLRYSHSRGVLAFPNFAMVIQQANIQNSSQQTPFELSLFLPTGAGIPPLLP